jgi:hypothetical protein
MTHQPFLFIYDTTIMGLAAAVRYEFVHEMYSPDDFLLAPEMWSVLWVTGE